MSLYRYIFGSLRNEQVIAEIDLFGTFITMEMNVGGQLNGSFILDQTGRRNQDLLDATIPGKNFAIVERNGIPIWGGIVWSQTYQSQAKEVQLFCQSFETYPAKQLIRTDFARTNVEQLSIFRSLWTDMQSIPERNLNINVPTSPLTNIVLKNIDILATDFKFYGEVMSSLSDAENGFDWYITITKDSNGNYRKDLLIGYPILGTPQSNTTTTIEYPGAILNYYQTQSMSDAGTNTFVVGAGEGSSMLVAESKSPTLLSAGWPRWDVIVSRKDVSDVSLIGGIANQEGATRRPPMTVIKASMKGELPPEFGSFGLGDALNLFIRDARNPNGLLINTRMLRWELQPSSSQNVEEVALVFAGDPNVQ